MGGAERRVEGRDGAWWGGGGVCWDFGELHKSTLRGRPHGWLGKGEGADKGKGVCGGGGLGGGSSSCAAKGFAPSPVSPFSSIGRYVVRVCLCVCVCVGVGVRVD